jgi:hypothetical protein
MLITHWLNLLRSRNDQGPKDAARGARAVRQKLSPFTTGVFSPWLTRRLQPVMVTPTTRRVRQLRARQRLS